VNRSPAPADPKTYLAEFSRLARVDWPANRMLSVACHGHSVPSGYFATPEIRTMDSYPHLLHVALAERFPHAVLNVIVTAIGGEECESGARRFAHDVLHHRPDVITIDYSLNDRGHGLERARVAWTQMITQARTAGIPVLLLTPTPDLASALLDPADPLSQHAEQVRSLAAEHGVGLVDSYAGFQAFVRAGGQLESVMSSRNHPNRAGHAMVADALLRWFDGAA
jgi:acyl-CoA thioesterase I